MSWETHSSHWERRESGLDVGDGGTHIARAWPSSVDATHTDDPHLLNAATTSSAIPQAAFAPAQIRVEGLRCVYRTF